MEWFKRPQGCERKRVPNCRKKRTDAVSPRAVMVSQIGNGSRTVVRRRAVADAP